MQRIPLKLPPATHAEKIATAIPVFSSALQLAVSMPDAESGSRIYLTAESTPEEGWSHSYRQRIVLDILAEGAPLDRLIEAYQKDEKVSERYSESSQREHGVIRLTIASSEEPMNERAQGTA